MTNMRHNGYHPPKENVQKEKENRCGKTFQVRCQR